jgi:hypothetical protein
MNINKNLLYCILGSTILAMLNSSIFQNVSLGLFAFGNVGNTLNSIFKYGTNVISALGFILVIFFSILLIINNMHDYISKGKKI